jgi:hypothetical protein
MLFTALLLLATPSTISLDRGYYTLQDVASTCQSAGVKVVADEDCAKDVYAIRIKNIAWDDFRKAIVKDKRIEVVQANGEWHIRRDLDTASIDAQTRARYVTHLRSQVAAVYTRAASECRYIAGASGEDKQKAIDIYDRVHDPDPLMNAGNNLIRTVMCANDMPFSYVGVPQDLVSKTDTVPYGKWVYASLANARMSVDLEGSVDRIVRSIPFKPGSLTDDDVTDLVQNTQLAARIDFEPISGAMTSTFLWVFPPKWPQRMSMLIDMSPTFVKPSAPTLMTLNREQADLLTQRIEAMSKLTSDPETQTEVEQLPRQTVSRRFLDIAQRENANVIGYVSTLSDFELAPVNKTSLSETIALVNNLDFREKSPEDYLTAVLGSQMITERAVALRIPAKLTISKLKGIYIIRNELAFLDELTVKDSMPPRALLQHLVAQSPAPLSDLASAVAQLNVENWTSSLFAHPYSSFCNPITFKPFAEAMLESKEVFSRIQAMSKTGTLTLMAEDLDKAFWTKLKATINSCAPIALRIPGVIFEPIFLNIYVQQASQSALSL